MWICEHCGSSDVEVAMWVNPNTEEVGCNGEWIFDANQAPHGDIMVQYCNACSDECRLKKVED